MATYKAIWNDETIAESDQTVEVEGNQYFPPESVNNGLLSESDETTVCAWKGTASYYNLEVNGDVNAAAAWFYPDPKPEAANIKDHVAFWKGVTVQEA